MKKSISSRMAIVTMAAAAILIMPTLALSTTLTPISSFSLEMPYQTGPPNTINLIIGWLGFDPIIGPGGYLTGVTFPGTNIHAVASASSMQVVSWYEVWKYGSTQTATDTFWWAAIYQLNGNPGWTADISLNYTYKNSRLICAFDGRSESKSSAFIYSDIVPASLTGSYSQKAADAESVFWWSMYLRWIPFYTSPTFSDYTLVGSLSYDENYYFAAITSADDTATGSFPVGSMEIGDQLYLVGSFTAETQAQAYWIGVTIATMVSSLETSFVINENPPSPAVPEPSTMLLLGSGLLGLWGARKKFKR